jgi:hypothetical protein
MRTPEGDPPSRNAPRGVERLRWVGRAANGLTDALLARGEDASEQLRAVAETYAGALDLPVSQIVGAAQAARGRLSQMTSAMGLQVPQGAKARRLLSAEVPVPAMDPAASPRPGGEGTGPAIGAANGAVVDRTLLSPREQVSAEAALDDALRQATCAIDDGSLRLNELLNLVLETMHRALELRVTAFCLRDTRGGQLLGRFALGEVAPSAFRITPEPGGDLFAALLAKGADTLIADARTVAHRLPAWYRSSVAGGTFLLLPLMVRGAPLGLIYADKAAADTLRPSERELALLRALRDQLIVAFTRGG